MQRIISVLLNFYPYILFIMEFLIFYWEISTLCKEKNRFYHIMEIVWIMYGTVFITVTLQLIFTGNTIFVADAVCNKENQMVLITVNLIYLAIIAIRKRKEKRHAL